MKALFFTVLLTLSVVLSAAADTVTELYSAQIRVADQSEEARQAAIPEALIAVLVKLTGRDSDWAASAAGDVVDKAEQYLAQFGYAEGDDDQLLLNVSFDPRPLDIALQERLVSLWGRERPRPLVWLAFRDRRDGSQRIITPEDSLAKVQREAAAARGLPIDQPRGDEQDRRALSFSDLWGDFDSEITQASLRYDAEIVIASRVTLESDGGWQARWLLLENGREKERWSNSAADADRLFRDGIGHLTRLYAGRLAVDTSSALSGGAAAFSVTGVRSLDDYAKVTKYLTSLSAVEAVEVQAVGGDELRLRLVLRGSLGQLQEAIRLGGVLKRRLPSGVSATGVGPTPRSDGGASPRPAPPGAGNDPYTLYYQLAG